jgi:hypothetical protein
LSDTEQKDDDSELDASVDFSDVPQMVDVDDNNTMDADGGSEGEDETVFDASPELINELGLTEDDMAEIDALDEEDGFDSTLLEEMLPNWEAVAETAIDFIVEEQTEMVEIAIAQTLDHLKSLCSEEEAAQVDWEHEAEQLELYAEGYLKGIADSAARFMPEFLESHMMAECIIEASDEYGEYANAEMEAFEEEVNGVMEAFSNEAEEIIGGLLTENDALQTKVNILESEAVIVEECKGLTMVQQGEIRSLLEEMPLANDTFSLSDYRSKVVKLKSKYKKMPKTGLLDSPSYHPKSMTSNKLMNATVDAMQKMTPRKRT